MNWVVSDGVGFGGRYFKGRCHKSRRSLNVRPRSWRPLWVIYATLKRLLFNARVSKCTLIIGFCDTNLCVGGYRFELNCVCKMCICYFFNMVHEKTYAYFEVWRWRSSRVCHVDVLAARLLLEASAFVLVRVAISGSNGCLGHRQLVSTLRKPMKYKRWDINMHLNVNWCHVTMRLRSS